MSLLRATGRGFLAMLIATLCLGCVYPAGVWAISRITPASANGHILTDDSCIIAARGLADGRTGEQWFHSRPEGMSNLSPKNPELLTEQEQRRMDIAHREQVNPEQVPEDAISGSASGVDDGISPAYAELQVPRVARENGLSEQEVREIVSRHTTQRGLGILGNPVVHVTDVNMDLPGGHQCAEEGVEPQKVG
ncbi:potassium-transporting ATPase subunit C [Corynebacterium poyangense]|uniref:Potassium-transporting ATPase subunit C n=1 Tax=Corynebacterium poyangense TaxID=2684405 RepID=A0A7H0SQ60_9CORY|nr:potassium-transporting ATPase subunit C [Corynebacterium poyangense]QNQ90685.1 potassium-transporting ATPase subunit C [Corynebacterium poyangense]